jgi:hypothetical protein
MVEDRPSSKIADRYESPVVNAMRSSSRIIMMRRVASNTSALILVLYGTHMWPGKVAGKVRVGPDCNPHATPLVRICSASKRFPRAHMHASEMIRFINSAGLRALKGMLDSERRLIMCC